MSLSYFPMYADDFEADTAHLTIAEDGAYNRLLRLCWRTPGCSIPADRQWIYRRMRALSDDDRAVIDAVLDEFFTASDGRLSNARLTKEWLAANEAHERRRAAGAKGGKAKRMKTNDTGPSNAKAKPKQPEPEPYISDTSVSEKKARKRAERLPENWTLPSDWVQDATSRGLSIEEAYDQAERMRDWSRSAPASKGAKLDWRAAWRNWIKRVCDDRGTAPSRGRGGNYADRQRASADAHKSASLRVAARLMGYGDDGGSHGDGGGGEGSFRVIDGSATGRSAGPDRASGPALSAPDPRRARG